MNSLLVTLVKFTIITSNTMISIVVGGFAGMVIGSYWDIYDGDIGHDMPSTLGILFGACLGALYDTLALL